ncbi:MAG: pyridoxal-phosphate dependent enzyme [Gemmatimonadetes bacterium]|nr:pyridoxal-phosphate dependent enzyme [Gemmatimonadota bacterium]MDE2676465.1 pyridoxal-phosphate dependent enzyme [Gemmatimonadota bacterium]MYA11121.1 pyridoxal-phosphate dependent enzyme [Gemmatimonadota bacterium]MYE68738.1 pyridoxal-phosphate dependent enzyme [Gemmatimonadota bacterium]MYJ69601.1 pyridoxal-phosphate dependent enzyme [Gemmatimonadota bacterium]
MTTPRYERPCADVLELVGWTPLVRLNRVTEGIGTPVFGKAEFMNPGGSVKDRIGVAIVDAAESRGLLRPGGTIVEATSGNTGLALAMVAAIRGYRCVFTMPDKMSREKVKLLRAFGAEVVITPAAVTADHPDHYVNRARKIVEETPGAFFANQFHNRDNTEAHYLTTGPEVWQQTEGRVTHFVAGAGTGGTISGTARYLKERNPEVRVIGVDPVGSVLSGFYSSGEVGKSEPYMVEGLGNDQIPGTLDIEYLDEYRRVSDRDAFTMARRLAGEEGLFVGGSTGLIVHAALDVAREVSVPDACVVAILCDWGERYLTKQYDDEWMRNNGFLKRKRSTVAEMAASKLEQLPQLLTVTPATPVRVAISTLSTHNVSQLPVVVDGECVGSVTERRLMGRVLADRVVLSADVGSVMGKPYPVVDERADSEAATRLLTDGAQAVLIRADGVLDGILTRHDLVRSLAAAP